MKKMNMNYSDSYISDSHDFADSKREASGLGAYKQVAYNPIITVLCVCEDVVLRSVQTSLRTKYEVLLGGRRFTDCANKREAEEYFMDFTGLTPAKFSKMCAKQGAVA